MSLDANKLSRLTAYRGVSKLDKVCHSYMSISVRTQQIGLSCGVINLKNCVMSKQVVQAFGGALVVGGGIGFAKVSVLL